MFGIGFVWKFWDRGSGGYNFWVEGGFENVGVEGVFWVGGG